VRACDCFCLGTAMGEGEYRSGDVVIRRMRLEDAERVDDVAYGVLGHHRPARDPADRKARALLRFERYLELDPEGQWVAEIDGAVVGTANAILREGMWGLALFAVAPEHQGRGVGRRLLDAALAYGDGARGGWIMSSEDPRAMRRYALAGFDLRPCVAAAGMLRTDLPLVEADESGDLRATEPISRAVRGAAHGDDLAGVAGRLLTLPGGFAIHDAGNIRVLAALDDDTATRLLRACFAQAPRGATVQVDLLTAGQDWAIRPCLEAGLALSPGGAIFTRGDVGPMRPYVPTGAWL
jgi:GNAT superfamily N-acetyltransferase